MDEKHMMLQLCKWVWPLENPLYTAFNFIVEQVGNNDLGAHHSPLYPPLPTILFPPSSWQPFILPFTEKPWLKGWQYFFGYLAVPTTTAGIPEGIHFLKLQTLL